MTTRERALEIIDLPKYFEPAVRISHILDRLGLRLEKAIGYLRTSDQESAQLIVAYYDRVPAGMRFTIDIDDLVAASRVDIYKIAGIVSESYAKVNAIETQMIAAGASPQIMEHRAAYALERDGHADAKMILQATGNAPVPKNQITTNYLIGNKIDQSKNVNIGTIPSLEDVVNAAEKPLDVLGEGSV